MIRVEVVGDRELMVRFERMPRVALDGLNEGVARAVVLVRDQAQANMAQLFKGPVAKLSTAVETGADRAVGTVTAGGTPYAAIHEFGGRTRPHPILPVTARVLVFQGRTGTVFARRVNHPGSKIPERSYLRSALAQKRAEIVETIKAAVIGNIKRAA